MLSHNVIAVLRAVRVLGSVSGYNPTIGEVSKVAGVTKGVATRALEKLCGLDYVRCRKLTTKRPRYSFMTTFAGDEFLSEKGWVWT